MARTSEEFGGKGYWRLVARTSWEEGKGQFVYEFWKALGIGSLSAVFTYLLYPRDPLNIHPALFAFGLGLGVLIAWELVVIIGRFIRTPAILHERQQLEIEELSRKRGYENGLMRLGELRIEAIRLRIDIANAKTKEDVQVNIDKIETWKARLLEGWHSISKTKEIEYTALGMLPPHPPYFEVVSGPHLQYYQVITEYLERLEYDLRALNNELILKDYTQGK